MTKIKTETLHCVQGDNRRLLFSIGVLLTLVLAVVARGESLNPHSSPPRPTGRTWLYLKPEALSQDELSRRLEQAAARMTPRALARRAKTLAWPYVRVCDLPPSSERLQAIEATGCRVVRVVRYVGAVVVEGSESALNNSRSLSFVGDVQPVLAYASSSDSSTADPPWSAVTIPETADNADYGESLTQSLLLNIPAAHDEGYHGEGVLIGVQDTGFETRRHIAFRNIDIVAAYDFLNDDPNVFDEGDLGVATHGTRVLSVIAGLDSGNYIGVAPMAQFVLTKTENSASETPIEEDIWVEGLWFHDSLGVDVLSSSLSYRDWHEYEDYDGRTSVTSRAADSAFAAGMVLVNSIGNTGFQDYPLNKMGVPADARGVISVGGVNRDSTRWTSSSQGPTYDGRIKPNVVAQSSAVYGVSTSDNTTYASRSGTSYSTPTVAGVAALIVQANPELRSDQVMDILHQTASQANTPDTLLGYGIANALAAVVMAREMGVERESARSTYNLFTLFPNPTNGRAMIVRLGIAGNRLELWDMSGKLIASDLMGNSINLNGYPAGSYWVGSAQAGWQRLALVK